MFGVYVDERVEAQVMKSPRTRARSAMSTTIPVLFPDEDGLFASLWVSFDGIEVDCTFEIVKIWDAVGVGNLKAVDVILGVVVGGGGCVAPIWTSRICPS